MDVKDGRVVGVTGDPDNDVYHGYTCVKGRNLRDLVGGAHRLVRSQRRRPDGSFEPLPSQRALDEIAARLAQILERHGPSSVATYYGTMAIASPTVSPFAAAFADAIGSELVFTTIPIDKPGKPIAKTLHGTWMAPTQGWDRPDVALLLGINPYISYQGVPGGNPGRWLSAQLRRGMELIVVDPRRSDVARRATIHLQPRPGHDVEILACFLRTILDERRHDAEFVADHVAGVDDLTAALRPFDPGTVGHRAGVDPDELIRAARMFADAARGYAVAGTGPSMAGHGTLVEYLVLCLHSVCGRWLRAGEAVACPPALLPARAFRAQATGPSVVEQPPGPWGIRRSAAGLQTADVPQAIETGGIRALISCSGNPVAAWPDRPRTIDALRDLDLLVQIDPWMSQTAQLADFVIAPTLSLEVPATTFLNDFGAAPHFGNERSYAHYTPAIVAPPEGSDVMEEWQFFYRLAQRLGVELRLTSQWRVPIGPVDVDMEHEPTTDQLLDILCAGSRVPLDVVRSRPSGGTFEPEEPVVVLDAEPANRDRLAVGNESMLAELREVAAASHDEDVPRLQLIGRRLMHVFNSSCHQDARPNPLYVHPADAHELGVSVDDVVRVISGSRSVLALVAIDDTLQAGVVALTHSFGELPIAGAALAEAVQATQRSGSASGDLVDATAPVDPISGMPRMGAIPVSIEPFQT